MKEIKKCGCRWLSFPDNEDGPAESFWDLCPMHFGQEEYLEEQYESKRKAAGK